MNNNQDSVSAIANYINQHLYSDDLEDDDPYFIGIRFDDNNKILIGNGSDASHLYIHITSRHLMNNLRYNGVHHIDATYKITTHGFPLIVYGVSDGRGKFFPVSFMISSHETEDDFDAFYEHLVSEAERLDIEFNPEFIMQDACDASKNAIRKYFPDIKVLF